MATNDPNVKLHPKAYEELERLTTALGSQRLPHKVDRKDIVSALILYTTEPQVAGVLGAYWDDTDVGKTAPD